MNVNEILFDENARLRSGWRFVIFWVAFISIVAVLAVTMAMIPPSAPRAVVYLASSLITLTIALFLGWICGRSLEGLPFKALGASFTKGSLTNLVAGAVIGGVTLALAVLLAVLFGGLRFEFQGADTSLGISFIVIIVAAAAEEALFRGYPFQTFVRSGLAWLAIVITSAIFAAAHLQNPNWSIISVVNTVAAGVWFGIAYLKTRDLWLVFGMHFMWNWLQGAVFGIEISGLTALTPVSLLREVDRGPAWLTGGTYGVEGGIVTTVALIVSIGLIRFLPLDPQAVDRNSS